MTSVGRWKVPCMTCNVKLVMSTRLYVHCVRRPRCQSQARSERSCRRPSCHGTCRTPLIAFKQPMPSGGTVRVDVGLVATIPRTKPWSTVRYVDTAPGATSSDTLDNPSMVLIDDVPDATRLAPLYANGRCPRNFFERQFGCRFAIAASSRSGNFVVAALGNGDLLIWSVFSGECDTVPAPPVTTAVFSKQRAKRASSVFAIPPPPVRLGYDRIGISDDARSIVLHTKGEGLWLCQTRARIAPGGAMLIDLEGRARWVQVDHDFRVGSPIRFHFVDRDPILGTTCLATQCTIVDGSVRVRRLLIPLNMAYVSGPSAPDEETCDTLRRRQGSIVSMRSRAPLLSADVDVAVDSGARLPLLHEWDRHGAVLALVVNHRNARDAALHFVAMPTGSIVSVAIGIGSFPSHSDLDIVDLTWVDVNASLVCLLSASLDIAFVGRSGPVALVCVGAGPMPSRADPTTFLPVTFPTGPPNAKPSLAGHPSKPELVVSNGTAIVAFGVGDAVWDRRRPADPLEALFALLADLPSDLHALVQHASSLIGALIDAGRHLDAFVALNAVDDAVAVHYRNEIAGYVSMASFRTSAADRRDRLVVECDDDRALQVDHALHCPPMLSACWRRLTGPDADCRRVAMAIVRHIGDFIHDDDVDGRVAERLFLEGDLEGCDRALQQTGDVRARFRLALYRQDMTGAVSLSQASPDAIRDDLASVLTAVMVAHDNDDEFVTVPGPFPGPGVRLRRQALVVERWTRDLCLRDLLRLRRYRDAIAVTRRTIPMVAVAVALTAFGADDDVVVKYADAVIASQDVGAVIDLGRHTKREDVAGRACREWLDLCRGAIGRAAPAPVRALLQRCRVVLTAENVDAWQQCVWAWHCLHDTDDPVSSALRLMRLASVLPTLPESALQDRVIAGMNADPSVATARNVARFLDPARIVARHRAAFDVAVARLPAVTVERDTSPPGPWFADDAGEVDRVCQEFAAATTTTAPMADALSNAIRWITVDLPRQWAAETGRPVSLPPAKPLTIVVDAPKPAPPVPRLDVTVAKTTAANRPSSLSSSSSSSRKSPLSSITTLTTTTGTARTTSDSTATPMSTVRSAASTVQSSPPEPAVVAPAAAPAAAPATQTPPAAVTRPEDIDVHLLNEMGTMLSRDDVVKMLGPQLSPRHLLALLKATATTPKQRQQPEPVPRAVAEVEHEEVKDDVDPRFVAVDGNRDATPRSCIWSTFRSGMRTTTPSGGNSVCNSIWPSMATRRGHVAEPGPLVRVNADPKPRRMMAVPPLKQARPARLFQPLVPKRTHRAASPLKIPRLVRSAVAGRSVEPLTTFQKPPVPVRTSASSVQTADTDVRRLPADVWVRCADVTTMTEENETVLVPDVAQEPASPQEPVVQDYVLGEEPEREPSAAGTEQEEHVVCPAEMAISSEHSEDASVADDGDGHDADDDEATASTNVNDETEADVESIAPEPVPFSVQLSEWLLGEDRGEVPTGDHRPERNADDLHHVQLCRPGIPKTFRRLPTPRPGPSLAALKRSDGRILSAIDAELLEAKMHAHLDEVRSAFPVPEGGDPSRITGFRTGLLAILNPAALQGDGLAWTQTTSSPALPPSALLDSGAPSMKFLSVQDIHEEPSLVVEADLVSGADPGVGCAFAVTDMVLSKDDADAISQLPESRFSQVRALRDNIGQFEGRLDQVLQRAERLRADLNLCGADAESIHGQLEQNRLDALRRRLDHIEDEVRADDNDLDDARATLDRIGARFQGHDLLSAIESDKENARSDRRPRAVTVDRKAIKTHLDDAVGIIDDLLRSAGQILPE